MNELLDTINLSIAADEKYIGASLARQYHQKDEPYIYFFWLILLSHNRQHLFVSGQ